jgi:hypothetical protein
MGSRGEALRTLVQARRPGMSADEVELLCLACIRRQVEAEVRDDSSVARSVDTLGGGGLVRRSGVAAFL